MYVDPLPQAHAQTLGTVTHHFGEILARYVNRDKLLIDGMSEWYGIGCAQKRPSWIFAWRYKRRAPTQYCLRHSMTSCDADARHSSR
eukprot:scaffold14885_cov113-Skeletonema_dohrnii-CCMP3373.AAC.1